MAQTSAHGSKHPYHLVEPSGWPAFGSLSALVLAVGALLVMHPDLFGASSEAFFKALGPWKLVLGFAMVLFTMYGWWRQVIHESMTKGLHSPVVRLGLRYAMVLFIASEVMFFVAFFWSYFHFSFYPALHTIGGVWPPKDIITFDPWDLPFLNLRIQPRRLLVRRQHLFVGVLHGDGLPRLPRARRYDFPGRVPRARDQEPVHARAPFRLRSGGLVLALRRRGVAVPVRGHLRVRRRSRQPAGPRPVVELIGLLAARSLGVVDV